MATFSLRQNLGEWFDLGEGIRALQPTSPSVSLLGLIVPLLQAAPMDLVSVAVDHNGLLRNPKWAFQVTHPGELPNPRELCPGDLHNPGPECTSQRTFIDSARICPNEGHVNWFPCTYEGPIFWIAVSDISHDNFGADDDYQWNHQPPDQAGLTINNDQFIELEFDSTETINHFTTPWWDAFHGTADESDAKAREVVDGKFAIVTGLIGLDCAHSCSTESHPVYAMAIHVQDDPADDVWAIFVRNWGNEGFCSDNDHQLAFSDNTYTFRLPWRPGASSVVASSSTVFQTNNEQVSGPAMTTQLGKAVLVSFTLPSPESHPRVNGELHLQWADAPARAMHPRVSQTPEERASEDHLGAFREMMTPAQREVFLQAMATEEDRTPDLISPAAPPLSAATSIRAQAGPISGLPQVVSVPDPNKADKDRRRWQAVRTALGGNVPGLPDDDPPA